MAFWLFGASPALADFTFQYAGSSFNQRLCQAQAPQVCLGAGSWLQATLQFSGVLPPAYTGNVLALPGVSFSSGSVAVNGYSAQTANVVIESPGVSLQAGRLVAWNLAFGNLTTFTGVNGDFSGSVSSTAGDNLFFVAGPIFYNGVTGGAGTWTILTPLQVTTISLPGVAGTQPWSASLSAAGGSGTGYTWSVAAGALPPGFSLNPSGTLSSPGGPVPAGQTYAFSVRVSDSIGNSATQALSLASLPGLQILTGNLPNATGGQPYTATLATLGGSGTGYTWSLAAGAPPGFTLTPGGTLTSTGTPPAAAQSYTFTVRVTDSAGNTAAQPLTLLVQPSLQITTTSLPSAVSGQQYSTVLAAIGGIGIGYTWSLAGAPPGFTLTASGTLASTGTPAAAPQSYAFTVKVTDPLNASATRAMTLVVEAPLQITTTAFPVAVSGLPWQARLAAKGGSGSGYTWSLSTGTLPPGFSLSADGSIVSTGSPPALSGGPAQTWAFTPAVFDASTGITALKPLTLLVNPPPAATPAVTPGGVVPLYSSGTTIQPGSWVSIYGTNLAGGRAMWKGDFPASLGGVSVTVNAKPAALWLVSPTQINLQAPDDTATGTVNVVVTSGGASTTSTVTLGRYAPSFSMLNAKYAAAVVQTPASPGNSGAGYDVVGPAGAFAYPARPVKTGETVVIYGVGFGPTSPAVPSGQAFSGAARCIALPQITIGGVPATVAFAGIVGAGLYQLNVVVPNAGSGDKLLRATAGGVATPDNVFLTLQ